MGRIPTPSSPKGERNKPEKKNEKGGVDDGGGETLYPGTRAKGETPPPSPVIEYGEGGRGGHNLKRNTERGMRTCTLPHL